MQDKSAEMFEPKSPETTVGSLEDSPSFEEHMELDKETLNQKILAKSESEEERIRAVQEIENKEAIEQIAYSDKDENIRLIALQKVSNLRLLAELVDDKNSTISEAARERLLTLLQTKH